MARSNNHDGNASHSSRSHSRKSSHNPSRKSAARQAPASPEWVRDFLSEMLAVEMGGIKLYQKALADLTHDDLEETLSEFLEQSERHAELCTEMLNAAGGTPEYISPGADAADQKAQALLSAEVMPELLDLNNIENLVLAETKDHWSWEMLAWVATRIDDPELKDMVNKATHEVREQEKTHLDWNEHTLTKLAMESATQPFDHRRHAHSQHDHDGHNHSDMENEEDPAEDTDQDD
jgi:rubrerythrin